MNRPKRYNALTFTMFALMDQAWREASDDPDCRVIIVMGKTSPDAAPHRQQSMVLVPRETPGVVIGEPPLDRQILAFDIAKIAHALDKRIVAARLRGGLARTEIEKPDSCRFAGLLRERHEGRGKGARSKCDQQSPSH